MAESVTRFGAVDENFSKTIESMEGRLDGFQGSVKDVNTEAGNMPAAFTRAAVAIAAFAAGVAATVIGVNTFKKALDFVGALDDLSKQTGATKDRLVVLQTAFDNTGTSATKVGQAMTKVQDTIAKAGDESPKAVAALDNLGLTFQELKGLSPDEQFEKIMIALGDIPDKSEKAQAATALFGNTLGRELIPLATEFEQEIKKASDQLGSLPDVLDKFGPSLTRFEENIDTLKKKPDQFAVGFVGPMSTLLANLSAKFKDFDAAGLGAAIGTELAETAVELLLWVENVANLLSGIWEGLSDLDLVPVLKAAFKKFEEFVAPVKQLVGTIYESIRDANYQKIGEKLGSAISYGLEPLKDFADNPDQALGNFYKRLDEMNADFAISLKNAVIKGLDDGVKLAKAFDALLDSKEVEGIGDQIASGIYFAILHFPKWAEAMNSPTKAFNAAFAAATDTSAKELTKALIDAFKLANSRFIDLFSNPAKLMAGLFGEALSRAFGGFIKVFVDTWTTTNGSVITKFGAAYNAVLKSTGEAMVGSTQKATDNTKQAGENLAKGGKAVADETSKAKDNLAKAKVDVTGAGGISPSLDKNADTLNKTAEKTQTASAKITTAYDNVAKSGEKFDASAKGAAKDFADKATAAGKDFARYVGEAMKHMTDSMRGLATENTLRRAVASLERLERKLPQPVLS